MRDALLIVSLQEQEPSVPNSAMQIKIITLSINYTEGIIRIRPVRILENNWTGNGKRGER